MAATSLCEVAETFGYDGILLFSENLGKKLQKINFQNNFLLFLYVLNDDLEFNNRKSYVSDVFVYI